MAERLAAIAWLSIESLCAGFARAFGEQLGVRVVALIDKDRTGRELARVISRNIQRPVRRAIADQETGLSIYEDEDPVRYARALLAHAEERRRIETANATAAAQQ